MQFDRNKKSEIDRRCIIRSQLNYSLLNFYTLQTQKITLNIRFFLYLYLFPHKVYFIQFYFILPTLKDYCKFNRTNFFVFFTVLSTYCIYYHYFPVQKSIGMLHLICFGNVISITWIPIASVLICVCLLNVVFFHLIYAVLLT